MIAYGAFKFTSKTLLARFFQPEKQVITYMLNRKDVKVQLKILKKVVHKNRRLVVIIQSIVVLSYYRRVCNA